MTPSMHGDRNRVPPTAHHQPERLTTGDLSHPDKSRRIAPGDIAEPVSVRFVRLTEGRREGGGRPASAVQHDGANPHRIADDDVIRGDRPRDTRYARALTSLYPGFAPTTTPVAERGATSGALDDHRADTVSPAQWPRCRTAAGSSNCGGVCLAHAPRQTSVRRTMLPAIRLTAGRRNTALPPRPET